MTLPRQFLRGRSLGEHVRALGLLLLLVEKVLVRDIPGHRSQVSRVKLECPGKLWFGTKAAFSVMMSLVPALPTPPPQPQPLHTHLIVTVIQWQQGPHSRKAMLSTLGPAGNLEIALLSLSPSSPLDPFSIRKHTPLPRSPFPG